MISNYHKIRDYCLSKGYLEDAPSAMGCLRFESLDKKSIFSLKPRLRKENYDGIHIFSYAIWEDDSDGVRSPTCLAFEILDADNDRVIEKVIDIFNEWIASRPQIFSPQA